ncbi:MAG TPA: hypothetical protein PK405_04250 [Hyphomicrobiales bacterium]|nr:hypothetical protein [Rhodobiaceae bacterium]HXK53875.1 hypothetical protein [Hyphomicrobiales bacterium]
MNSPRHAAIRLIQAAFFALLAFVLPAAPGQAGDQRDPVDFLRSNAAEPPANGYLSICHAYGCTRVTRVRLSDAETGRLKTLMAGGKADAAGERAAVASAIAYLEQLVGPRTGTTTDRDYRDLASGGDPTQMDCIDEASNTTSYLILLRQLGLLRHHEIAYPASKGFLINFVYPHFTAVLVEKGSGTSYAVDSWVFTNGEKPIIAPLDAWYETKSATFYQRRKGA